MTLFFDRVDACPIQNSKFDMEFTQWLSVLVDTLNEDIVDIQGAFNLLQAQSYTSLEITNMATSLPNGVLLYDSTLNVYVGKISGALVKFSTTPYP